MKRPSAINMARPALGPPMRMFLITSLPDPRSKVRAEVLSTFLVLVGSIGGSRRDGATSPDQAVPEDIRLRKSLGLQLPSLDRIGIDADEHHRAMPVASLDRIDVTPGPSTSRWWFPVRSRMDHPVFRGVRRWLPRVASMFSGSKTLMLMWRRGSCSAGSCSRPASSWRSVPGPPAGEACSEAAACRCCLRRGSSIVPRCRVPRHPSIPGGR